MKFVHYFLLFNVFVAICLLAFFTFFNRRLADKMNFVLTRFTCYPGYIKEYPKKNLCIIEGIFLD